MTDANITNIPNRRWVGDPNCLMTGKKAFIEALTRVNRALFVVQHNGMTAATYHGTMICGEFEPSTFTDSWPLLAYVPGIGPKDLGESSFKADYGLKYAYIMGAMANGISSVDMVRAAGKAGMVGFFGSGGLSLDRVETAAVTLLNNTDRIPIGFNLIHSPNDQALESALVDLYIKRGVTLISASAFLGLTPALIHYRVKGICQTPQGEIICPNHIIAKISREEVAKKFLAPPPESILNDLVHQGKITPDEAKLARFIPLAQDITAEADSGGHTDNRPALTLLPTIFSIRDWAARQFNYPMPLRVGLGGGIATPESAAAAFAMGAAYILTGSINQSCREADTSPTVRNMLAEAQQADVMMAPAADMFELGAKVQVLKRGTMFALRAAKLHDLYRQYDHYDQIPQKEQRWIESEILKATFEETWQQTLRYFEMRNPKHLIKAERDPKFKMALVFRSYLGQASLWAKYGERSRMIDYQIWCGPAMGAFNAWAKGGFLEKADNREVVVLAMNLLYGACGLMRYQWLNAQHSFATPITDYFRPLTMSQLDERMAS